MDIQRIIGDIDAQIAKLEEIKGLFGGAAGNVEKVRKNKTVSMPPKPRRTMSPETKARMAAAQKARWAKVK